MMGPASGAIRQPAVQADLLAGVVLEVGDLANTRAFYERIFRDFSGAWQETRNTLTYTAGPQAIEFVRRPRPRTLSDGGQHQAYRVRAGRLQQLAEELTAAGFPVDWWREDHPTERGITAYLHDPSGNRVQLVASDGDGLLLDHVGIEVRDFDYCETVYVKALAGRVDYYHGWRVEDEGEAKLWGDGDDPCAPWTRRDNPGWFDFARLGYHDPNLRVPRPNTQVFVAFGDTRIAMISATKVRQEPPEELLRGAPRPVFRTQQTAAEAVARLPALLPMPFDQEGQSIFLRDPDGNFLELRCAGAGG